MEKIFIAGVHTYSLLYITLVLKVCRSYLKCIHIFWNIFVSYALNWIYRRSIICTFIWFVTLWKRVLPFVPIFYKALRLSYISSSPASLTFVLPHTHLVLHYIVVLDCCYCQTILQAFTKGQKKLFNLVFIDFMYQYI